MIYGFRLSVARVMLISWKCGRKHRSNWHATSQSPAGTLAEAPSPKSADALGDWEVCDVGSDFYSPGADHE